MVAVHAHAADKRRTAFFRTQGDDILQRQRPERMLAALRRRSFDEIFLVCVPTALAAFW